MKKLLVTVGPSLLSNTTLREIHSEDYIYRINGAHGTVEEISKYIHAIRAQLSHADILLDLPGNKIRTANLAKPIRLTKGGRFELMPHQINLEKPHKYFKVGDQVLADDSTLRFTVDKLAEGRITFVSHSEGELRTNKGLHVRGINENMPFLLRKDRELIGLARKYRLGYVGLSFVRTGEDVALGRKLVDFETNIICKVETKAAVDNLNEILKLVEYILIDRGDLSTDVGLEKIPSYQKFIIEKAHFHNKKVFLSTQFLKNMEANPVPTIAEVTDLYNTLKMGVYGIQLSEETSVGKHPTECLNVIRQILKEIDSETL